MKATKSDLADIPDFFPGEHYQPFPSYEEFRAAKGDPVKKRTVEQELREVDVMALARAGRDRRGYAPAVRFAR